MAANEVMELVIRVSPEGADETADSLENVEETFEETADTAGEQTGVLDDFSRRWAGAMSIIVGSLTLAAGALASQMPIVADLMDGFMAIVEETALVLDEKLRPSLNPIVDAMFDLAKAIGKEDTDGAVAALKRLSDAIGDAQEDAGEFTIEGIFTITGFGLEQGLMSDPFEGGLAESLERGFRVMIPGDRFIEGLIRGWIGAMEDIAGVETEEALADVSATFQAGVDRWGEIFDAGMTALTDRAGEFDQRLTSAMQSTFERVQTQVSNFRTWVDDQTEPFRTTFERVATAAKDAFTGPMDDAEQKARDVLSTILELAATARSVVEDTAGSVGLNLNFGGADLGEIAGAIRGGRNATRPGGDVAPTGTTDRGLRPGASSNRAGANERNRFATRDQLTIRFLPQEFQRFLSGAIEDGVANTGRGSGPQG